MVAVRMVPETEGTEEAGLLIANVNRALVLAGNVPAVVTTN
jgi:hypothetical protein